MTEETKPLPPERQTRNSSRVRNAILATTLVGSGLVAGGVLASGMTASAASTTSTTVPATSGASGSDAPNGPHGGYRGLDQSGTVAAVGTNSVTIKTSSATTTYSVTASSDLDKNGEATLTDLSVGDAVTFSTTGSNVIDKLHAGTESLDMPQAPPSSTAGSSTASSATGA